MTRQEWVRLGSMAAFVLALHIIGWGTLVGFIAPRHFSVGTESFGIGIGVTAYTLGMRHAFDADHIAAIDNTTRKLVADGQRPVTVGLFFSLGHSTVVFVMAMFVALGAKFVGQNAIQTHGGIGITQELAIGHYFKRATMIEGQFGSADYHLDRYEQLTLAD